MMRDLACSEVKEVDLLVFGAGAGGMTAALTGAFEGLDVLLCEKTDQVGGTTSTSGGTTWVPGTSQSIRSQVPDSVEGAKTFLASAVGARDGEALRLAFLQSGAAAIDELEVRSDVHFVAAKAHPDYLGHPGAAYGGRALVPLAFDGRLLGKDFDRVRAPRPEFLGLGGMMVGRDELKSLLSPFKSLSDFITTLRVVVPYFRDRVTHKRGTRLLMGNALVGRLLLSLKRHQVPIWYESSLAKLIIENGDAVGALVTTKTGQRVVRARRGIVLATGGISWNKELRERLYPEPTRLMALAPHTNTGEGVAAAVDAGAEIDDQYDSSGLWMPCSVMKKPGAPDAIWPHIILDRAKPGLIAVNASGCRFANEADSYHDFSMAMLKANAESPSVPSWLVCDASFIRDYGLGLVLAGRSTKRFVRSGYLTEADTLRGLAEKIGVGAENFERTINNHNRYAAAGIDEEFGRGSSVLNRFNGDPENKPNPCMRPIAHGPFYALAVYPMDLASSAGLKTDELGRVLSPDQSPIRGLYACGNDMASIFRGTYPGPGTTLGPAIVFGWRIAKHLAGTLPKLQK